MEDDVGNAGVQGDKGSEAQLTLSVGPGQPVMDERHLLSFDTTTCVDDLIRGNIL